MSNKNDSPYGEYYYQNCCGSPYVRDGAIWDHFSRIADQIVENIAPRTVLDAGCAKGFMVELLRKRGIDAWGFDVSEYAISEVALEIRPFCSVRSVTEPIDKHYDLIICQEVLEHVSEEEARQAIHNLCSHTDDILFSSSPIDFTEPTHINVRPPESWYKLFAEEGFFRDFNLDASFITPWAVRFLKQKPISIIDLGESYEKELWRIKQESLNKDQQFGRYQETIAERDGQVASLNQALNERDGQVASLNQALNERDGQVASLNQALNERDGQVASLNQALNERARQVASIREIVNAYQNSTSWWLTKPVRFIGRKFKQVRSLLTLSGVLFSNLGEIRILAKKVRRARLAGVEFYLKALSAEDYAAQYSKDHGLSPEFLQSLIIFGTKFLQIKEWWVFSNLRRKCSSWVIALLHGETKVWRKSTRSQFRLHVDNPKWFFKMIMGNFVFITGWCVDLEAGGAGKVRVRIGKIAHRVHFKQRPEVQKVFASICELPINVGFVALPTLGSGMHRMWIDIQSENGTWICVRRVFLLCLPRLIRGQLRQGCSYKAWTLNDRKQLRAELPEINRHMDVMLHKPKFTVVIDVSQNLHGWRKSLQSVRKQIYPHYELRVLPSIRSELPSAVCRDATPIIDSSLREVLGDFIIFIESGQLLSENALYEFANAINQTPDVDLVYGDQDRMGAYAKRFAPFYKPDWSPDYLETFNYIGFPACFRTTIARDCFDSAHVYDFVLRFTEKTSKIQHVTKILGHDTEREVEKEVLERAAALNIAALKARLNRTGRQGTVREHELHRGCFDIMVDLARKPLVSIVIPTDTKTVTTEGRLVDPLSNIIGEIQNGSTYKNIEIIVVDDGNLSPRQEQTLSQQNCRRITYGESAPNISRKLNLGASIAKGEIFILMRDDIIVLTPSWIERMVEHFEKPHVGVVGAKLLCLDGRTEHIGVVHNFGNPDHVRWHFPGDEAGYYFSTCGVRNFMAVTMGVIMTSSKIYRELGGYTEELAGCLSDMDYCLKVHEKGFQILYAPSVLLKYRESRSYEISDDLAEVALYQKLWGHKIATDPYYNERFLSVAPPTFVPHVNQRLL